MSKGKKKKPNEKEQSISIEDLSQEELLLLQEAMIENGLYDENKVDPVEQEREEKKRKIRQALFSYSRGPFLEVLATAMACEPTPESIQAFANKSPDRYAQYITQMARLWGFTEKLEIQNNINVSITQMSDMQLLDYAKQQGLPVEIINGEYKVISEKSEE